MFKKTTGPVHKLPKDIKDVIESNPKSKKTWDDITPLAKNEWICWVESVKLVDTRIKKLNRIEEDLAKGKRRPCCWPGCPHRQKITRK